MLEALRNARDVRRRLRNPSNAVHDDGIDLKRKRKIPEPPPAEIICEQPAESTVIEITAEPADDTQPVNIIRRIPAKKIAQTIADHFRLDMIEMMSHRRTERIVVARQIAMYLVKEMTTFSYPAIAKQFDGRDHTTVLHAVHKIAGFVARDPEYAAYIEALKEKAAE